MDILDIGRYNDTATVFLRHPETDDYLFNEDGSEMTIEVYGPDSAVYKSVIHEQQDRRLSKMSRGKTLNLTAAELESSSLDLLVKCTKEWNITFGKKKPKCDSKNVREVYEVPWVREQVEETLNDRRAFLTK